MRSSGEQWRKRVQRWRSSRKTAREFAERGGFNLATFRHWIYVVGKENRRGEGTGKRPAKSLSRSTGSGARVALDSLVELRPSVLGGDGRLEVQLGNGRVLRVPPHFDLRALKDLIVALEVTP